MASEIRVNKINSQTGVGTITLSPTGVDIAGITTAATFKVGTGVTASSDGDIFATGVCTATTFSGSGASLTNIPDSALSAVTASKLTGALPAISGANLTGISGVSVANQADNRLITATGTTDALNGEATATYNGTKLFLSGGSGNDQHIPMLELKHLNTAYSSGNGDGPALLLNGYYASNEWALAKIAAVNAGGQYGSGYAGGLQFWVHPANGTQTASVIKGAEIIGDGTGANLTINDGNLTIGTSGHGIDFSATGGPNSGSGTSELFDDYEEGTFTPNIQGTGSNNSKTYSQQKGKYTKIGNIVHCEFRIAWTNAAVDSGIAIVNGLPFVIDNATGLDTGAAIGSLACNNVNFVDGNQVTAAWEAANGQQYVYFLVTYDNGGWSNPGTGAFNNTGAIRGSVTYRVAS